MLLEKAVKSPLCPYWPTTRPCVADILLMIPAFSCSLSYCNLSLVCLCKMSFHTTAALSIRLVLRLQVFWKMQSNESDDLHLTLHRLVSS